MVCVSEINANFVCYSTDGLSLGWLLKDELGNAAKRGSNAIPVENAAQATLITDRATGKPVLYAMATADIRVLELMVPLVILSNEPSFLSLSLSLSSLAQIPRAYEIEYYTQGDGQDALFYNDPNYTNAFPWEWVEAVPTFIISKANGQPVAEVRTRRDSGELCIYAIWQLSILLFQCHQSRRKIRQNLWYFVSFSFS